MKNLMLVLIISAMIGCSSDNRPSAPAIKLITSNIDAKTIVSELPVTFLDEDKSNNGRVRARWAINSTQPVENNLIEIVGNNQSDADKLNFVCVEYDKAGNYIKPLSSSHFCHHFFVKVLGRFIDNPAPVAMYLINGSIASGENFHIESNDFSFEVLSEYYTIRHISRIDKDY